MNTEIALQRVNTSMFPVPPAGIQGCLMKISSLIERSKNERKLTAINNTVASAPLSDRLPYVPFLVAVYIIIAGGLTAQVINVRDHGAYPGVSNAAPGIQAAIDHAKTMSGNRTVRLEKGIYDLYADGTEYMFVLSIKNETNLTLDGSGSLLRIHNPRIGGLVIRESRNIIVRGISVDYDPLPFTQGTVGTVDIGNNRYSVVIDDGYPAPDDSWFTAARDHWGVAVRKVPGRAASNWGPIAVPYSVQKNVGGREWLFEAKGSSTGYSDPLRTSALTNGDRMVLIARNWSSALSVHRCEDTLIEDVMIHSAAGLTFFPYLSSNLTVRRYHVARPAGSTRLLSANADGMHPRGMRGTLTVEDSSFEAMTDDGISIHSYPIRIVSQDSSTLLVKAAHVVFSPGDTLELESMKNGAIVATPKVIDARPENDLIRLTLDGMPSGNYLPPDYVMYNASGSPSRIVITGCSFGNHRVRPILLRGRNALISNNTFRAADGWGVVFWNYLGAHPETGPVPARVRIIDNTFYGAGGHMAAIFCAYPKGIKPVARSVHDIEVIGNRFIDIDVPAMEYEGVSGITVRDNVLKRTTPWVKTAPESWFTFINCDGVQFNGNAIEDDFEGVRSVVRIKADCAPGSDGFSESGNRYPKGKDALLDERR